MRLPRQPSGKYSNKQSGNVLMNFDPRKRGWDKWNIGEGLQKQISNRWTHFLSGYVIVPRKSTRESHPGSPHPLGFLYSSLLSFTILHLGRNCSFILDSLSFPPSIIYPTSQLFRPMPHPWLFFAFGIVGLSGIWGGCIQSADPGQTLVRGDFNTDMHSKSINPTSATSRGFNRLRHTA